MLSATHLADPDGSQHRVFVALYPPAAVLADVATALDAAPMQLRWQHLSRLHLTLAFAAANTSAQVRVTRSALKAAVSGIAPPPRLQLSGAGSFSRGVLWLGISEERAASTDDPEATKCANDRTPWLRHLAQMCHAAVRGSDAEAQRPRRWVPHLTIVRGAAGKDRQFETALGYLRNFESGWWRPHAVHLMESLPSLRHRHVVLDSFALPDSAHS